MKFVVDKGIKENPIKRSRQAYKTEPVEDNFLNKGIMDGIIEVNFVSTDVQIGEVSHVFQVKLEDFDDEKVFKNAAISVDKSNFSVHNTNFIKPVNYFDLTSFGIPGESPTYRVDSGVNYYNPEIERLYLDGIGLPNIYKETIQKPKITKQIVEAEIAGATYEEQAETRVLFDSKLKLSAGNSNKRAFPCYSEVVITKRNTNIFTKILSRLDLFSFFMDDVTQKMSKEVNFSVSEGAVRSKHHGDHDHSHGETNDPSDIQDSFRSNFLRYLIANISNDNLDPQSVISNRTEQSKTEINFLDKLEAIGELQKESVANSNFKTLLENKSVPNETVFYKIEKFAGLQTQTPMKTYFLPCEKDVMTFVDTEVGYNSTYSYKVTAFVIIYGASYVYNYIDCDFINRTAKYKVVSTPSPMLVEFNLFTGHTTPATTPPLYPSVNFINESSSESSIKMAFSLRKGSERAHFIKVLPSDVDFVYRKDPNSDRIKFSYRKEPIRVQIMRLEKKPTSIFDFENSNVRTIFNMNLSSNREMMVRKDYLFSNKKYYFCFRTVSGTGMVSNPSPVYEVELIKTADESRIVSKIIKVDEDRPHVPTISLRKLLQIRPALHQSIIHKASIDDDMEGSILGEIDNINSPLSEYSVGTADFPIWGRKFKIRIKSTTSGKMIDLNVNFDLIKDEKNEDL